MDTQQIKTFHMAPKSITLWPWPWPFYYKLPYWTWLALRAFVFYKHFLCIQVIFLLLSLISDKTANFKLHFIDWYEARRKCIKIEDFWLEILKFTQMLQSLSLVTFSLYTINLYCRKAILHTFLNLFWQSFFREGRDAAYEVIEHSSSSPPRKPPTNPHNLGAGSDRGRRGGGEGRPHHVL